MSADSPPSSRRVVMISYFFPPVGGVGVQRTLKFVTHLPRWGWEPVVVTPRDPGYALRDPSLLADVPEGLDVRRSLSLEPARLVRSLRRRFRSDRARGRETASQARSSGGQRAGGGPLTGLLRAGARLWNRVWNVTLFPEEAVAWLPFGLRSAVGAVRGRAAHAVYSSSPPPPAPLLRAPPQPPTN